MCVVCLSGQHMGGPGVARGGRDCPMPKPVQGNSVQAKERWGGCLSVRGLRFGRGDMGAPAEGVTVQ